MSRCAARKPNGERCKVEAIPDAEWCWSHHPDYEAARRRRASKGGRRGGRGRPQTELADIKGRLSDLAEQVLAGDVDRSVAAVASQILTVYLRAISEEMNVREVEELTARLEALEDALEGQSARGGGMRRRAWLRRLEQLADKELITFELKDGTVARFSSDAYMECLVHEAYERGSRHFDGEDPGPAHPMVEALRKAKNLEALTREHGTLIGEFVGEDEIMRGERERPGPPVQETSPGVYE